MGRYELLELSLLGVAPLLNTARPLPIPRASVVCAALARKRIVKATAEVNVRLRSGAVRYETH